MSVYILRDNKYTSVCSRSDNFSMQWMRWYRFAKFAPTSMTDFSNNDIIIVNLDDTNSFNSYTIPNQCRKIVIVQKLHKSNIDLLNMADHVIYINELQRRIAQDIYGVVTDSSTCPRHPMHEFTTEVNKQDHIQISGWLHPDKTDGLYQRLLNLNKTELKKYKFIIQMIGDEIPRYKKYWDKITQWLADTEINGSRMVEVDLTNVMYDIMLFNIRLAKKMYLWREEISVSNAIALIDAGDISILDHWIGESSMLAHAQAAKCSLIVDDAVSFYAYHNDSPDYTYTEFAHLISDVINTLTP